MFCTSVSLKHSVFHLEWRVFLCSPGAGIAASEASSSLAQDPAHGPADSRELASGGRGEKVSPSASPRCSWCTLKQRRQLPNSNPTTKTSAPHSLTDISHFISAVELQWYVPRKQWCADRVSLPCWSIVATGEQCFTFCCPRQHRMCFTGGSTAAVVAD